MSIRVATAPVSWGIMEVEGWEPQKHYGQVLDEMQQAGYAGTELGPYGYFPTEPEKLSAELNARGLVMISAFVPVKLSNPSRHEAGIETAARVGRLLSALGCKTIVLADEIDEKRIAIAGSVSPDGEDGLTDKEWTNLAEGLHTIARQCLDLGLRTVFHHHAGTFIETPQEVERLLAITDPELIGLCLDTGHYRYGGGDPIEALQKFGRRIRYVHLKDVNAGVLETVRRDKVDFFAAVRRGVFCELGEGCIDFPRLVEELNRIEYDGWVVVEQDIDPNIQSGSGQPTPLESATANRRYLREVVGI